MRFPWLDTQWQLLSRRFESATLPQGIILHGLPGLGKREFALDFAQYVLCESPRDEHACQHCRACQQFQARTHPDLLILEPEETGKVIKIDQVRTLINQLGLASHQGRYRVVIIYPAEDMNQAAANSLLKMLEEPPGQTLFLLVSHRISALLPTIRSRCQQLAMPKPDSAAAMEWLINNQDAAPELIQASLAMTHGAPLAAQALIQADEIPLRDQAFSVFRDITLGRGTALPIAQSWLKAPLPAPIHWLYSWVSDIAKFQCEQEHMIINRDKQDDLQKLAQRVELPNVMAFLDVLLGLLRMQRVALNPQMTMEELLIRWQTMTSSVAAINRS